jgi:hypothetical protein
LVAAVTLGTMESWQIGVIILVLNLVGDLADCHLLSRVARLYHDRPIPKVVLQNIVLSGVAQSLTIGICVVIAWAESPLPDVEFFSTAFLAVAAINAALSDPFIVRPQI